jgi:hypothetical protein
MITISISAVGVGNGFIFTDIIFVGTGLAVLLRIPHKYLNVSLFQNQCLIGNGPEGLIYERWWRCV